jgi:protein-L-isoaspartate(D-aspartate) O-methyltransferase
MVERQISARGVTDPRVLAAMRDVPREAFVGELKRPFAFEDTPLPIGAGQTISQPYIVAMMTEALNLKASDRVLEIGTGSGYAAAVLSRIAREVYSVERHAMLAERASETLKGLAYDNVRVHVGDGTLGWPEHAPYDAISVTAAGPQVPQALLDQLAEGGRMVIPVGSRQATQALLRVTRRGGTLETEELLPVHFVPLTGAQGFAD